MKNILIALLTISSISNLSIANDSPRLVHSWPAPTEDQGKNYYVLEVVNTALDNSLSVLSALREDDDSEKIRYKFQKYSLTSGQLLKEVEITRDYAGTDSLYSSTGKTLVVGGRKWINGATKICNLEVMDLVNFKLSRFNTGCDNGWPTFIIGSEKLLFQKNLKPDNRVYRIFDATLGRFERTYKETATSKYESVLDLSKRGYAKTPYSTRFLNNLTPSQSKVIDLLSQTPVSTGEPGVEFYGHVEQKNKFVLKIKNRYFLSTGLNSRISQPLDENFHSESVADGYYWQGNISDFTLSDFQLHFGVFRMSAPDLLDEEIKDLSRVRFSPNSDSACGILMKEDIHLYCGFKSSNEYKLARLGSFNFSDFNSSITTMTESQIRIFNNEGDLAFIYDGQTFNKTFDRSLKSPVFMSEGHVAGYNRESKNIEYWEID